MPEGDTLFRAAAKLRPALAGATVVEVRCPRLPPPQPAPGERVLSVESNGKHLLIAFSGGLTLHTHLGMTGIWRLHERGARWSRAPHLARAVIVTEHHEAVCFSAPRVELVPSSRAAEPVAHLGPDLCADTFDADEAVARMAALPDPATPVLDVLLDQRVMAGVGNVFKSEVLWACGIHPLTPLAAIDDEGRRRLVATARKQLRANLAHGRRTTVGRTPGTGQVAVYGRARRPCPRCHHIVETARLGVQGRSTYWCPNCQPPP